VSERWQSVRLDDIEPISVAGGLLWRPLRRTLGVGAFGINAYIAPNAGDDVVESHSESRLQHQELYLVLAGRATFTLDDDTVNAPAGTAVFIRDPAVKRHARAEEPGTAVLAVGGKPGEAYAPSAWEAYFYAEKHRATAQWDLAIADLQQGLNEHPDNPGILYALACFESLDGRKDDALAHLQRAVEVEPNVAEWAKDDADLDPIRDLSGFPKADS